MVVSVNIITLLMVQAGSSDAGLRNLYFGGQVFTLALPLCKLSEMRVSDLPRQVQHSARVWLPLPAQSLFAVGEAPPAATSENYLFLGLRLA